MNAADHTRARALAADIEVIQEILKRWANENQEFADENERLYTKKRNRKPPQESKPGDPPYPTQKQLGERWGMQHGSILRKLRRRELPCLLINSRSIRVAMRDVWRRYDSLQHFMDESGERLVLQFTGCEVTLVGANFGEIMELIPGNRLEWVRDLPVKYRAHKGPEEPFIERLEVRTLVTTLPAVEVVD
jgi:hypothetical protein